MKTILKSFCAKFSDELDPYLAQLNASIANLASRSREEGLSRLNETVTKLTNVQNRARTLQEKLANQHAYLLIFGPLKSGKSTLMNAISGAYVSEVSCLPTYPALVYVKDGEKNRFQATTYLGAVREYSDSTEMKAAIQNEYSQLAEALLDAEKSGQEFDPEQDHPAAIRRVDVELPAENLAESGTVLVDTPGLYSRMKFGYDQMTKDFRDTAACAIFVVKTDDLFFEKVFEEFEELLGYFSRIFLVSNIDSSKQDLQPDGTLDVSLEGSDPEKVIEAFRSLSISATLQQAIEDGRLNIYSIDLLKAASRRLSAKSRLNLEAPINEDADTVNEDTSEPADDGFDLFLGDLTSYLNSSDYLHDFMTDTVGLAKELIQEEVQDSAVESSDELRDSCDDLRAAIEEDRKQVEQLSELKTTDWSASFTHLRKENEQLLNELAQKLTGKGGSLETTIDEWMQSDESWQDLLSKRINPVLKQKFDHSVEYLVDQLRVMLNTSTGGARFSFDQTESLSQAGMSLDKKVPQLLQGFAQNVDVPIPRMEFQFEGVPIKTGLMDKLLFRNETRVREQLFGAEGGHSCSASKKKQRLEGAGVEYLRERVADFAKGNLPDLQKKYANQLVNQYIDQYCDNLKNEASTLQDNAAAEIRKKESRLEFLQEAIVGLEGIRLAAEKFSGSLGQIESEFGLEIGSEIDESEDQGEVLQFDDEIEFEEMESGKEGEDPEILNFEETSHGKGDDFLTSAGI